MWKQLIRHPGTYLAILAGFVVLTVADTFRPPQSQVTAKIYVASVRVYQAVGRPLLDGRVECRFRPTCSEYSIEAVRKYGIREGLLVTYDRLNSCETNIPMGTLAPVP